MNEEKKMAEMFRRLAELDPKYIRTDKVIIDAANIITRLATQIEVREDDGK